MYAALPVTGVGLLAQYGLFVLLVVFVLEGALVGKLVPTRALFVAAVLTVGGDGVAAVVAAAVVGATVGQVVLFGLVRYADVGPDALPGAPDLEDHRLGAWFDRWGPSAVAVSNTLPVARGSLTVPAAMSETSLARFSATSLAGTVVYACALVVLAAGLEAVLVAA